MKSCIAKTVQNSNANGAGGRLLIENKLKQAAVPYQMTMQHGDPGPAIVSYANHHDVDIVIIGSRGLNTLQEMVLGSVSHKVAKRVKCPVLIVK